LTGSSSWLRAALPLTVLLALLLRIVWPLSDPTLRFSWSNGIYTDPATMVHAARNAVLFDGWILDYNRDLYVYPLMNALTWILYVPFGPGRFPTLILSAFAGAATVATLAWGLRRSAGPRAALIGAVLAATCHWLAMFSRIPISENVVGFLLTLSCVAVMGRSARSQAVAGALGVGATLFGKYHAAGFLPGLLAFVALRERSVKGVLPLLGGGTAIFLLWVAGIFLPHSSDILGHVERQSTGLHGDLPFAISLAEGLGEIFNTLRRSWMFYRMPVCGILGSLFAMWVIGNGSARKLRIRDGTAIYAFWFLGMWAYYSVLPYKAPRYYVLLAPPLVAGCAVFLSDLFSREGGLRLRPPNRWDEHLPLLVWLYALAFGAIDAIKHYASMSLDYLTLPPPRISGQAFEMIVGFFKNNDTFYQNLAWAGVIALVAYLLILWHPEILRPFGVTRALRVSSPGTRGLGVAAISISLAFAAWQYGWWVAHRTTFLEDVKSSLPAMIGEDAVLIGPMAPLLTQDTRLKCLPYFGPPRERGLLEKYGVTHLVVCGKGDEDLIEKRYPGLFEQTTRVQTWPVKTLFAGTLELRRVPNAVDGVPIHDYRPTAYEEGSLSASQERWREALDRFEEFRGAGGPPIPELLSLEAVCWFKLDSYDQSEELLREAIRRRPMDPLNYQNLGVLALKVGDRSRAFDNFMKALRLDPKNGELENMVRELAR
jgi:hypothetical protein